MSAIIKTKYSADPETIHHWDFGIANINSHLDNLLGFHVDATWEKWIGVNENYVYVSMGIVIDARNIQVQQPQNGFVDRILAENSAGLQIDDNVLKVLKPFMYTKEEIYTSDQQALHRQMLYGITGERRMMLDKFSTLQYWPEKNLYLVYLRPERIIKDMVSNPETNDVDGQMSIIHVSGKTPETLIWNVVVGPKDSIFMTNLSAYNLFKTF